MGAKDSEAGTGKMAMHHLCTDDVAELSHSDHEK